MPFGVTSYTSFLTADQANNCVDRKQNTPALPTNGNYNVTASA